MEEQLNGLLNEMKTLVNTGAEHNVYMQPIETKAKEIYEFIEGIVKDGFQVWAYKYNGRILKIGKVGELKKTKFSYGLTATSPLNGDCNPVVINRFEVHENLA